MVQDPQRLLENAAADELARRFGEDWLDFAERWAPSQRKILTSDRMYLFAIGGNGAGKTTLGGWWLASQLNNFNPLTGKFIERQHKETLFYAVAPTVEKIKGLLKPALKRWIPKNQIERDEIDCLYLTENRRVMWKTGSQEPDTFTGDEIDGAWIDEEVKTEEHWRRIMSRGFRRLAVYLTTMTAENGTLWLHQWMESPDETPMEEKEVVSIDTRDNPYFKDCDHCSYPAGYHEPWHPKRFKTCKKFDNTKGQQKLALRIRQCSSAFDFKVRIQGLYLILAGSPVIDPEQRKKLEDLHMRAPVIGFLSEGCKFVKLGDAHDPRAWLRISVTKKKAVDDTEKLYMLTPQRGHTYVIGVDGAEGNPTGDYNAAVVIDFETGEQCALGHTRAMSARSFGAHLALLGKYYNDAYIVVESNNHGGGIIDQLIGLNYGNIYKRETIDAVTKKMLNKGGFLTTSRTKKPAVGMMAKFFTDRMKVHDPIIYSEARNYTWLADAREGSQGVGNANAKGHDDTMTAMFCAAVGLRRLGWDNTSVEDTPAREYEKTVADMLLEDSSGKQMDEQEMLDSLTEQDAIRDVFLDDAEDREWIP